MTAPTLPGQRSGDALLKVKEVLEILDIERSTFYDWRAKRRAPRCVKLPNGQLRVRRSVLDAWIEAQEERN
ncbi:helix-turn-helix transcriptional regulator [Catellatospora citrea]|uniref:Excisionase n=1 Tax=Catellatospora citrea TaxID=53366 RepID=A0A8J3P6C4_9ACTN|nr:helix-turn-helix domain-containing protein [Catellatospora citrea]RKE09704.1 AlpA family transcriptional regulator [Catellatospora citrea]GIG03296.1 excisionase [Catellatospora citrea]